MSMWVMDDYLVVNYGNVAALESATWFVLDSDSPFVWRLTLGF